MRGIGPETSPAAARKVVDGRPVAGAPVVNFVPSSAAALRSAAAISAIEGQRSPGALASALSTTASSPGEICGFFCRGGGGALVTCISTTSPHPSLMKGGAPVSSS